MHGCGIGIAYALARCGFGDDLLHAISHKIPFVVFFQPWIEAIQAELCTDSRHFLGRRYPGLTQCHALTFARTTLIPQILPPGPPAAAGGSPQPHPVAKKLQVWVKCNIA